MMLKFASLIVSIITLVAFPISCQDMPGDTPPDSSGAPTGAATEGSTAMRSSNISPTSSSTHSSGRSTSETVTYNAVKYADKDLIFKGDTLSVIINIQGGTNGAKIKTLNAVEEIPEDMEYIGSNLNGKYDKLARELKWYLNLEKEYPNDHVYLKYNIKVNNTKSCKQMINGATNIKLTYQDRTGKCEDLPLFIEPQSQTILNRPPEIDDFDYPSNIWLGWWPDHVISLKVHDVDNQKVSCKLLLDGGKEINPLRNRSSAHQNIAYVDYIWEIPNLNRGEHTFKLEITDNEVPEMTVGDNPTREFAITFGFPILEPIMLIVVASLITTLIINFVRRKRFNGENNSMNVENESLEIAGHVAIDNSKGGGPPN